MSRVNTGDNSSSPDADFTTVGICMGTMCVATICYYYNFVHNLRSKRRLKAVQRRKDIFNRKGTVEICLSDILSLKQACKSCISSVELCTNRIEGGVTPSIGLIEQSAAMIQHHDVLLHVLIRPRAGDFHYTEEEFEVIQRDILAARQAGADGIVFGALDVLGRVDLERMGIVRTLCEGLVLTFHRAFDVCSESTHVLIEQLVALGCDRILTSGTRSRCGRDDSTTTTIDIITSDSGSKGCTSSSNNNNGNRIRSDRGSIPEGKEEEEKEEKEDHGTLAAEVGADDGGGASSSDIPGVTQRRIASLAHIRQLARGRIQVVAAGGVSAANVTHIITSTGVDAVHCGSAVTEKISRYSDGSEDGNDCSNNFFDVSATSLSSLELVERPELVLPVPVPEPVQIKEEEEEEEEVENDLSSRDTDIRLNKAGGPDTVGATDKSSGKWITNTASDSTRDSSAIQLPVPVPSTSHASGMEEFVGWDCVSSNKVTELVESAVKAWSLSESP